MKLRVNHRWNSAYSKTPVIGSTINVSALDMEKTTDYAGNIIYEDGQLKRILVDGGYWENGYYYFHHKDHLGNNVMTLGGNTRDVQQRKYYYPFGSAFPELARDNGKQPYKFGGKEFDQMHRLDMYDFHARQYDSALGRFTTVDPHAEKYFSWSPYAYCANNPIRITDPTGMDWYYDNDGTRQYSPNIKSQDDLKKGQTYIGVTDVVKDEKGNIIENYRKDGSIMYANEKDGYNRIISNTQKTGNEEFGVITDDGVLVLPSYLNEPTEAKYIEYGYSFKNGNLVDPVSNKELTSTIATVHTHPNGGDMTADGRFARINTPQKPMFALMVGGGNSGSFEYLISTGQPNQLRYINVTKNSPQATTNVLINGRMSLREYSKSIIKAHTKTGSFKLW